MPEKCVICDLDLNNDPNLRSTPSGSYIYHFDCKRCGKYEIQSDLRYYLLRQFSHDQQALAKARAQLSHWVRNEFDNTQDDLQRGRWRPVQLNDRQLIENILSKPLPNLKEQANNYIYWIGSKSNYGNDQVPVNKDLILSIIGSHNYEEFELVTSHLRNEKGFIKHKTAVGGGDEILRYVSLTVSGWDHYEELKRRKASHADVDTIKSNTASGQGNAPNEALLIDITKHEFDVALSFPGEIRDYVESIAKELEIHSGPHTYFYDNNYKSQLARPSLDTLLQDIYRNRSKLIVVFLCEMYQQKEWCGIEFRPIREIIMERQHDKVMFVRMDDGEVEGVFKTDGYIDGRVHVPEAVAGLIKERILLLKQK